jgi:hypothetical protein
MEGQSKERWQELCELAYKEQNPQRVLDLVEEINQLLEEKERRFTQMMSSSTTLPR